MPNAHSTDEFGRHLRARRRELRLSQADLADVIGVNRRVLGELENGKPTVRLEIALEAARALGMDVDLVPRRR
jgi:HTH-type transcriptional regulator / antitoxin HipB